MTERRVSRTAAVLLLGVLVLLLCASSAGARVIQTDFFTINVKPASPSSHALFLGVSRSTAGAPVTLQTYQPGNRLQQWTPVWPTYPGPPEITGGSELPGAADIGNFFAACLVTLGLPPACHPGFGAPRTEFPFKYVNRGTGMCLAVLPAGVPLPPTYKPPTYSNGTPVLQSHCTALPKYKFFQTWNTQLVKVANPKESRISLVWLAKDRCLDVKDFREAVGATLQIWQCHGGINWNQQFRFLSVAQVRCEVGVTNKICGVPGSPPTL